MTLDDVLLRDVLEAPDDDLPRMVYADWLTDQGDPRGEFIHAQCLLARMAEGDPRRPPLEAREGELLALNQDGWLGPLRPLLARWTFRRGFLDAVAVPVPVHLAHGPIAWPATVRRVEVDLAGAELPPEVTELVPTAVAYENALVPIGLRGRAIVLAMTDPGDTDTLQKLAFILNIDIEPVAAPAGEIAEALDRYYGQAEVESVVGCVLHEFTDVAPFEADSEPVAKLVDLLFDEAVSLHADQIRLLPGPDGVRVSYRIGGQWAERDTLPDRLWDAVTARIRLVAGIDPAGPAEGQVGRVQRAARGKSPDLEVTIQADGDGYCLSLVALPPLT